MSFDWTNYNNIAKELNNLARSGRYSEVEALHRSSISRHYYAMHHMALKYAVANLKYVPPTTNNKHTALKDCYVKYQDDLVNNISYACIRDIGNDLNICLGFRVCADYKPVLNRVGYLNNQTSMRADRVLNSIK